MQPESPVLSDDALAAQLSQALPVYVSSKLISQNPKLGHLLERLTEHITVTGVRAATQQQLNNATSALTQARTSYMEQVALSHYLRLAVNSSTTPKALQSINDAYTLAELAFSVRLPFETKSKEESTCNAPQLDSVVSTLADLSITSSLGNSGGNLSNPSVKSSHTLCSNSSTSHAAAEDAADADKENCSCSEGKMCSVLSAAVKNKPEKHFSPVSYQLCSRRVLAERAARLSAGSKIPALLAQVTGDKILAAWHKIIPFILPIGEEPCGSAAISRLLRLKEERASSSRLLHSCSVLTNALLLQVDEQLAEYGEILTTLVKKRRLSDLPHHQLLHLCIALNTQLHKLRYVELQILCSTYTPSVLAGLRSLSRDLEERTTTAEEELASLQHQLEPYLKLDPSYLALLDEYKKLQADIEFCSSARK